MTGGLEVGGKFTEPAGNIVTEAGNAPGAHAEPVNPGTGATEPCVVCGLAAGVRPKTVCVRVPDGLGGLA